MYIYVCTHICIYIYLYSGLYLFPLCVHILIYVFRYAGPHFATATAAFEVAMNFNLQKLVSAIADAPATVESGKLYRSLGGEDGHSLPQIMKSVNIIYLSFYLSIFLIMDIYLYKYLYLSICMYICIYSYINNTC